MARVERLERRAEWRKKVAAFRASGRSGAAWCAAEGIRPHLLYYWLARLEATSEDAATTPGPSQWLPVEVDDRRHGPPASSLVLRIGGVAVEVQPGFDARLLADVVRVLTTPC